MIIIRKYYKNTKLYGNIATLTVGNKVQGLAFKTMGRDRKKLKKSKCTLSGILDILTGRISSNKRTNTQMHSRPPNLLFQSMLQFMNGQVSTQSCTMQLLHTHLPKSKSAWKYQLLCFASKVVHNQINTKSQFNQETNII